VTHQQLWLTTFRQTHQIPNVISPYQLQLNPPSAKIRHVPPKRRYPPIKLHDVATLKNRIWIIIRFVFLNHAFYSCISRHHAKKFYLNILPITLCIVTQSQYHEMENHIFLRSVWRWLLLLICTKIRPKSYNLRLEHRTRILNTYNTRPVTNQRMTYVHQAVMTASHLPRTKENTSLSTIYNCQEESGSTNITDQLGNQFHHEWWSLKQTSSRALRKFLSHCKPQSSIKMFTLKCVWTLWKAEASVPTLTSYVTSILISPFHSHLGLRHLITCIRLCDEYTK